MERNCGIMITNTVCFKGGRAMKRSGVIFAVKIAVLALLDAGTIALLFFPRSILADALFPWMAANVLLALFLFISSSRWPSPT